MFAIRCVINVPKLCQPRFVRCLSDIQPPTINGNKVFSPKIESIVASIADLNLSEVSDLNELLQKKLSIKPMDFAMPSMAVGQTLTPNGDASTPQPQATKSSFSVKLLKFDPAKKVPLIKELKSLVSELNLVQAKKLVEGAPEFIKRDVSKEEAEEIKKVLTEQGAEVSIE